MKLTLKIWRQPTVDAPGKFETHHVADAKLEMTILELLDRLNDTLVAQGAEPVAFESDCREGICGQVDAGQSDHHRASIPAGSCCLTGVPV